MSHCLINLSEILYRWVRKLSSVGCINVTWFLVAKSPLHCLKFAPLHIHLAVILYLHVLLLTWASWLPGQFCVVLFSVIEVTLLHFCHNFNYKYYLLTLYDFALKICSRLTFHLTSFLKPAYILFLNNLSILIFHKHLGPNWMLSRNYVTELPTVSLS